MRLRVFAGWVLALLAVGAAWAQDPNFSQFYAAPLYLNPALAGAEKDPTFAAVYRSQWRSLGFPQQIGQFSGVLPFASRKRALLHPGGLGFAVYNDLSGEGNHFRATGIQAGAAYNVAIARDYSHVLSFGLQMGLVQKAIDFADLRWGSQYNAAAPFFGFDYTVSPTFTTDALRERMLYPVVHSGVVWHFNPVERLIDRTFGGFVGFSVSNLNRPEESLVRGVSSRLPMLVRAQAGFDLEMSPSLRLMPNLLWMSQGSSRQINVGTYLSYELQTRNAADGRVMVGGWYRLGDSFVASAALANGRYTLGFSYDVNTSSLRYASRGRGAWEMSLTYRIPRNKTARRFATPLI